MKTKTLLLAIVAIAVVLIAAFAFVSTAKPAKNFGDDASPVMYFYSETCEFCKKQMPILQDLSKEGFRVKLMDVGAHSEYWQQYSITGTPTFLAPNGDRHVGLTGIDELRTWLSAHNAKIAAPK